MLKSGLGWRGVRVRFRTTLYGGPAFLTGRMYLYLYLDHVEASPTRARTKPASTFARTSPVPFFRFNIFAFYTNFHHAAGWIFSFLVCCWIYTQRFSPRRWSTFFAFYTNFHSHLRFVVGYIPSVLRVLSVLSVLIFPHFVKDLTPKLRLEPKSLRADRIGVIGH